MRVRIGIYVVFASAAAFMALSARADYITNVPQTITQPDGTVLNLLASGDEYYNWLHDRDGFVIVQDPVTGYYVYAIKQNGEIVPSPYIVGKIDPRTVELVSSIWPSRETLETRVSALRAGLDNVTGQTTAALTTGTINNIVVFIRFSDDSEFTDSPSFYDALFNGESGTNSMRNYYDEASYDQLTIDSTFYPVSPGPTVLSYQDSNPRAYYQPYNAVTNPIGYTSSNRGAREQTLLANAVNAVTGEISPDLDVDHDGDGNVDSVCFVVRGGLGAWADLLWPHCSVLVQPAYINTKRVYTYNLHIETRLASGHVGVLCHEMAHTLGAPDLYHYAADQRALQPVGGWDLMEEDRDPPQHMCAYLKYRYLNWIPEIPVLSSSGDYALQPLTSPEGNCYKAAFPTSATEYFVLEYRRRIGVFESSLPGSGLLVYRINTSVPGGNRNGPPDEVYIYRPGGGPTTNGYISQANFSSDVGRTQINDGTDPASLWTDGTKSYLDIVDVGSAADAITFRFAVNQVRTPSFSPDAGVYASPQNVVVKCMISRAVIHYTTNGLDPTTDDPVVASGSSVPVSASMTLKARAFLSPLEPSYVKSAVYRLQHVFYVNKKAEGPLHDGTSWQSAFLTVQEGIDNAVAGAEVWVAADSYTECVNMKNAVELYGGFNGTETDRSRRDWVQNVTIIDADNKGSAVALSGCASTSTRIDGFTIRNGSGRAVYGGFTLGGGIYCHSSVPVISNNTVSGNRASRGAGIYCGGIVVPVIINNTILRNTGDLGSGLYSNASRADVTNNDIVCNESAQDGGAVYCESISATYKPTLRNNLISWNSSGITRDAASSGAPDMLGNNVFGNREFNYSLVPDPTGTSGNMSADPLCASVADGDFHLRTGSPCVDAGTAGGAPTTDQDGFLRPQDGDGDGTAVCDTGAYEDPLSPAAARQSCGDGSTVSLGAVSVTGSLPDTGCIYVEALDRSSGIRVATSKSFLDGQLVNVSGTMQTDTCGERYVQAFEPAYPEPVRGCVLLRPIGMANLDVGGGPAGLQQGVELARCLNNIGLLVKTWGRITEFGPGPSPEWFIVDDGTVNGVKVVCPSCVTLNASWGYVSVIGLCSCESHESGLYRVLRVRGQSDITPY